MSTQAEQSSDTYQMTPEQQQLFNRVLLAVMLIGLGVWLGSFLFSVNGPLYNEDGYKTNLYTEFISIGITVGLLNFLAEQREKRRRKRDKIERLRREVRSDINSTARSAVNEAREEGWLTNSDKEPIFKHVALTNIDYEEGSVTDLTKANLNNANLEGSYLAGGNLYRAKLQNANLQGANLEDANLTEANLNFANLRGARLARTWLMKADFIDANLQDAFLRAFSLQEAFLNGANLQNADLRGVLVTGASLVGTNLKKADLSFANLENADLHGSNLRGTYLEGAIFNENTTLPDGSKWNSALTDEHLNSRFGAVFDYVQYHNDKELGNVQPKSS